jgi:hypothetical protein
MIQKALLIIGLLTIGACEYNGASEHHVILRNESSNPVYFYSTLNGEANSGVIDTNETESFFVWISSHKKPHQLDDCFDLELYSIQGQDSVLSPIDLSLPAILRDSRSDDWIKFYDYWYLIKDSIF